MKDTKVWKNVQLGSTRPHLPYGAHFKTVMKLDDVIIVHVLHLTRLSFRDIYWQGIESWVLKKKN